MIYKTVVADPPWLEQGGGKSKRGADAHYALLSVPAIIEAIHGSSVWNIEAQAHFWCWATSNHLQDALFLIEALGFRYVSSAVWIKVKDAKLQQGLGQYMRHAHEWLLFSVRGAAMVPPARQRPCSVIVAQRTEHSRKPDAAYDLIESVSPGPYLELFARAQREGWQSWGAESPGRWMLDPACGSI